jgi:hypothetical protein
MRGDTQTALMADDARCVGGGGGDGRDVMLLAQLCLTMSRAAAASLMSFPVRFLARASMIGDGFCSV